MGFRKSTVTAATRCKVALSAGGRPDERVPVECAYCEFEGAINWTLGPTPIFAGLELDHVVPELYGGETSFENILLVCRRCNREKGAKSVDDFLADRFPDLTLEVTA